MAVSQQPVGRWREGGGIVFRVHSPCNRLQPFRAGCLYGVSHRQFFPARINEFGIVFIIFFFSFFARRVIVGSPLEPSVAEIDPEIIPAVNGLGARARARNRAERRIPRFRVPQRQTSHRESPVIGPIGIILAIIHVVSRFFPVIVFPMHRKLVTRPPSRGGNLANASKLIPPVNGSTE